MFTRNVCAPRFAGWFQRLMHESVVAAGLVGVVVPGCVVVVDVVVPSAPVVVVLPVVPVAPEPATVVPLVTVALVLDELSSPPKSSSAARKPTAFAGTAISQVFEPLRSIAAGR